MEKPKLIFIALTINHHSLYLSMINFLNKLDYDITLLTLKDNTFFLNYPTINENIKVKFESGESSEILKKNKEFINLFEVLIIDEFYGKIINLYQLKFKNKTKICIVHNVNKWVSNKLMVNPIHIITYYIKKMYFNQFDSYITMGPNIKSYLAEFTSKKVFFFSFDILSNKINNKNIIDSRDVTIVIPGTVSAERRNNLEFFIFLKNYFSNNPNSNIKIKLLGKMPLTRDNEPLRFLITQINETFGKRVSYWNEFIPPEDFEHEILTSDLILSNLNVINNFDDRIEIYGLSKESGISFVIYKYAKPAIIPHNQHVLVGFENQLIPYYSYKQLQNIFIRIENGDISLKQLNNNALKNSLHFNDLINQENQIIEKYLK